MVLLVKISELVTMLRSTLLEFESGVELGLFEPRFDAVQNLEGGRIANTDLVWQYADEGSCNRVLVPDMLGNDGAHTVASMERSVDLIEFALSNL